MCFTSGPTSDGRGRSLTDGLRDTLVGSRRKNELPASRLSKSSAGVKSTQPVVKVVSPTTKASLARAAFNRLGPSADMRVMQNADAKNNGMSPKGVPSERFACNSEYSPKDVQSERYASDSENLPKLDNKAFISAQLVSKKVDAMTNSMTNSGTPKGVQSERYIKNFEHIPKAVQSERYTSDSDNRLKLDKKTFISAQFASKIKAKQMKGMMKGMRRAASTVTEKLPNSTKKKNEERARLELLGAEPKKPQARNADEIKKAYGHATVDTKEAALMTRDKLHQRREKISAIHRQTAEMEANAANFASLAEELAQKMEAKKWYSFN